MNALCFSTEKLNELLTFLYLCPCEVLFSEIQEIEIISKIGTAVEFPLLDALTLIGDHFDTYIESFDALDLGDLGIGFAFFLP